MRYVVLEKSVGETPLEVIEAWREKHPQYKSTALSYAGRLDPMASGKLLILIGEECKKQRAYTDLDKEYELELVLDIASDTGDALGLTTYDFKDTTPKRKEVLHALLKEQGAHERAYPAFSSKTVDGKPLFLYALSGTLDSVTIPTHTEHIYRIELLDLFVLTHRELQARVQTHLAKTPLSDEPSKALGADFRIKEVQKKWSEVFAQAGERSFSILKLRVTCGSGTYMRTLAPRIGASLGTSALLLSLRRTRLGKYWHGWWLKTF